MDHIIVGIVTYKRPQRLVKLLRVLDSIETKDLFSFSVLVVDNDASMNQQKKVIEFARSVSYKLDYVCEPRKGISHARNTCLASAKGDYLAFIDDDDCPDKRYLLNMYETAKKFGADIVHGSLMYDFEEELPKWKKKIMFYPYKKYKLGEEDYSPTGTGHSMIMLERVKQTKINFSQDFSLSGGEDVLFFKELQLSGLKFAWADTAKMNLQIDKRKSTLRYVVLRVIWVAMTNEKIKNYLSDVSQPCQKAIAKRSFNVLGKLVCLPFFLLFGLFRPEKMSKFCKSFLGDLGILLHYLGFRLEPYV